MLKMPKGWEEAVILRTDNIMAKRKKTGKNQWSTKIVQHEHH
jgi:hypothetical protein